MTLNELSARAMGWKASTTDRHIGAGMYAPMMFDREDGKGFQTLAEMHWSPSTCTDDALLLLEKVANGKKWTCGQWSDKECDVKYWCELGYREGAYGKTLALAITRAALRAFGIPESELKE